LDPQKMRPGQMTSANALRLMQYLDMILQDITASTASVPPCAHFPIFSYQPYGELSFRLFPTARNDIVGRTVWGQWVRRSVSASEGRNQPSLRVELAPRRGQFHLSALLLSCNRDAGGRRTDSTCASPFYPFFCQFE
jgi:hypothetical protein